MKDTLPPAPNLSGPEETKKPLGCGAISGLGCLGVVGVIVLVSVLSTLGGDDDETAGDAEVASSRYTQTWSQGYAETSCDEWNLEMTSAQQFAAAADILTSARNKIDGGVGLPPDALISEFQAGVTNVCIVPTMTLTDATSGLYTTEPRFHP
ncbi:hypothetical protein [Frigoribacterium sp. RIT-PI-h]|uniref:hypothetical protein n=1 Tax=Frigoribacterium sp. RIT-PI-h TaxID=1690245 RepID=UPI000AD9E61A|nr:hypothetical protein [Frigoribacterium sp. RIT-PI-h]